MVISEIWNDDVKNAGACGLQPLLTCRHFYHIANKHAWKNTNFDMRSLSKEKLQRLLTSVPPGVTARVILSVTATAPQVDLLGDNVDKLPNIKRITMTDFESENEHLVGKAVDWMVAMVASIELRHKIDCFMATAAVFEGKMPIAMHAHTMNLAIQAVRKGEKPVVILHMENTAQAPERYLVLFKAGVESTICQQVLRSDDTAL